MSPHTHSCCVQVVLADRGKVLHVHRLAPSYITTDFFPAPVGGTCGGFLCDEVRGGDTASAQQTSLRGVYCHSSRRCTVGQPRPPRRVALVHAFITLCFPSFTPPCPRQMGLGKSLQTLMLIKANPPPPNWTHKPVLLPAPSGGGPRLSALPELPDREPAAIKTTLLVTPANLQVRRSCQCTVHARLVWLPDWEGVTTEQHAHQPAGAYRARYARCKIQMCTGMLSWYGYPIRRV